MTPFAPTSQLQQLTGLGVNVRASIPGYPTTTADGHRRWILGHDDDKVMIDEDHTHGVFLVHAPDLPAPLAILEEDVYAAAAGVANLIQARLHDARENQKVLDSVLDEALGCMLVGTLRVWPNLAGAA